MSIAPWNYALDQGDCKAMVGPGWPSLIDRLFELVDKSNGRIIVLGVKEKFGTLRIDAYGFTPQELDFIDSLEDESGRLCEYCGRPGKIRSDLSWTKTLCRTCHKKSKLASAPNAGRRPI